MAKNVTAYFLIPDAAFPRLYGWERCPEHLHDLKLMESRELSPGDRPLVEGLASPLYCYWIVKVKARTAKDFEKVAALRGVIPITREHLPELREATGQGMTELSEASRLEDVEDAVTEWLIGERRKLRELRPIRPETETLVEASVSG